MAEWAYAKSKARESRLSGGWSWGRAPALLLQLANLGLCFCSESEVEQEIIVLCDTEKYIMEY